MVEASVAGGQITLPASTVTYELKEEEIEEAEEVEGGKEGGKNRSRSARSWRVYSFFSILFPTALRYTGVGD